MTNYEYHKSEIEKLLFETGEVRFGVGGNKVQNCGSITCNDCIFLTTSNCGESRKEWLKQEYNVTKKEVNEND